MARWDEILSLPVQNPPSLEFSAGDIVWSKVEGWRDNIDRVALIPFARVDDFLRGESSNKDCPTRFHVEARRRRRPTTAYKPKVDGVLEYILYWCSFGPDDHRKGGIVRPSRTTYVPKKKKNAGRPNTKRGCTCHFIVKRLIAEPSVALIIYNDDRHVDKKGLPCHGPLDKKATGTHAVFAPYISEDLRLRVLSLLYVGVSVETIMQRHNESVERQGGPCNRDDLLTHRYVRRQERSIRRSTYELDPDDSVSVSMWVESNQSNVFFYEDFSDSDPFTLGIQTEWQLQQMIRFGSRNLLVSDSRFGTNKLKHPVHSLLVFNPDNKAIPVAWIISPRFATSDCYKWMRALHNRVQTKDPSWKLAGFIVDDPLADVDAIRDVFQCSVLLSFWRVRHAWHKNLMKKCIEKEIRVEISKRLGQVVDSIFHERGTVNLFEDFLEDFVDEAYFMDYFKATWYPRLGKWIIALQTLPIASQETCAALEFYHNQLKVRVFNEKNPNVYQRTDWLVDKLNTKVQSYFWLDEYSGKDNFARYRKEEWVSGLTSWRKALDISDSDVIIEGGCAKVTDQLDRDRVYVVWNPGSEFGICECCWAEMGNLCEHMLKVISLRRRSSATPSVCLIQYQKALMNMLHCPPHDSLIRDHAVSLAVFVQAQINALVSESKNTSNDEELPNGRKEDILSKENGQLDGLDTDDRVMADVGGQLNDPGVGGNGISGDGLAEEMTCSEMDVDPSSICISPPGLHSVDEVVSSGILIENTEKLLNLESALPSKDATFSNTNSNTVPILSKGSQESQTGMESISMELPPPTMEFSEQCTVTHHDDAYLHDLKPVVVSNTVDADTLSTKASQSVTIPIKSQAVEIAEGSYFKKDD